MITPKKVKVRVKKGPNVKEAQKVSDATSVKKPLATFKEKPSYEDLGTFDKKKSYLKSDSAMYEKGFSVGVKNKKNDNNSRLPLTDLYVVGLNDRFNEGYSEGKRNQNKKTTYKKL